MTGLEPRSKQRNTAWAPEATHATGAQGLGGYEIMEDRETLEQEALAAICACQYYNLTPSLEVTTREEPQEHQHDMCPGPGSAEALL